MSDQNQLAIQQPRALASVAALTGLDQKYIVDTLKAQCFKGQASDAQVDAFISIAMEMKVNPLLPGMLYAFPVSGGGIIPIMGPSGVYKKLTEHPDVDSWQTTVYPEDVTQAPTHATARIYRKSTDRPLEYTALLSEWRVASNKNWGDRPRHMLALRALKHCANQIIHGIPGDEDDRVIMGDPINVTPAEPQSPPPVQRADPKPRKGAAAAKEAAKAAEVVVEQEPAPAVTEPKNVTPEPVKEPAKEAPKPVEQPKTDPAPATPRAFLKDGEVLECVAEVISSEARNAPGEGGKVIPSALATIKGDYCGAVRHLGGGKVVNGKTVVQDMWQPGKKLNVKLRAKLSDSKEGTPNFGKILVWVDNAEEVAEQF